MTSKVFPDYSERGSWICIKEKWRLPKQRMHLVRQTLDFIVTMASKSKDKGATKEPSKTEEGLKSKEDGKMGAMVNTSDICDTDLGIKYDPFFVTCQF